MRDAPETQEELLRYMQREMRIQRRRGVNSRSPIGLAADVLLPRGMVNGSTGEPVFTYGTDPYSTDRTEPPGRPSTPSATSRLGVVTVCWDGLTDEGALMPSSLQRVELHRSFESDFIPTADTWVQNLTGPSCASITDQTYGTTYFYRLVAVNRYGSSEPSAQVSALTQALVDTDVIGQVIHGANIVDGTISAVDKVIANSVTSELIQALAIKAGHLDVNVVQAMHIAAGSIDASKLSALLVLSSKMASSVTGRRWEADQFGIRLYAADGTIVVNLPTDAAAPATFSGDVLARSITITNQFALRGTTNEVAKGGVLTLAGGTTPPNSPPSIDVTWESVAIDQPYTEAQRYYDDPVRHGWVRNGSYYYTAQARTTGNAVVRRYSVTTGDVDPSWTVTSPSLKYLTGGVTFIGNTMYVMGKITWSDYYRVESYDITTMARLSTWTWLGGVERWVALGTKGTNLLIAYYREGFNRLEISEVTPTGTDVALYTSDLGYYDNITSVLYGNFDFGAPRFIVTYENRAFDLTWQPQPAVLSVSGTVLSYVAEQVWLVPNRTYGMCWDSTLSKFVRLQDDVTMIRHSNITWTAAESSTWWASHTWYDSNATGGTHETSSGPLTSFTMQKRALVSVTLPPLPPTTGSTDDPVAARVYLGRGAAQPLRTKMERQATLADGVSSTVLSTATLPAGGADAVNQPPALSNFPNASPAELRATDPLRFSVKGDGSGAWGSLTHSTAGVTTLAKETKIVNPLMLADSAVSQAITANVSTLITWPSAPTVNEETWTKTADNIYWVCPRDGTYTIFLQVQIGTNVTGTNWVWAMIYADTADGQMRTHGFLPPNTNSVEFEASLPTVRMTAGQQVWTYLRSNIANSITAKSIRIVRTGG